MDKLNYTDNLKPYLLKAGIFIAASSLTEIFAALIFPTRPSSMDTSLIVCLSWGMVGYLSNYIQRTPNKIFLYTAFGYYLTGNINAIASYFHYGIYYLTNLQDANLTYCCFTGFFSLGLITGEAILISPKLKNEYLRREEWNTLFFIGSMIFPFIWIIDEILFLGNIPILTGASIVENMYSLNYGKLYGYGVLLGISALLMWAKLKTANNVFLKILLMLGLAITIFIMIFDGRRVFLLNFLGALAAFEIISVPSQKFWKRIFFVILFVVGVYIIVNYFRQGGLVLKRVDAANILSQVGVEYRDFAYMYTHHAPGSLIGYNWLASAIGGFGNQFALALLGLDKGALVFSGSAYQIALLMHSSFGIRIGLIPEVWLQYGMLGAGLMIPIGVLFVWFSRLLELSKSEAGLVIACMTYGVLIFSFVGQTSAITGYLSLILYLWLIWRFLEAFRFRISNLPKDKSK